MELGDLEVKSLDMEATLSRWFKAISSCFRRRVSVAAVNDFSSCRRRRRVEKSRVVMKRRRRRVIFVSSLRMAERGWWFGAQGRERVDRQLKRVE